MDAVIAVLLIFGSFYFAFFIFKRNRIRDQNALDKEITNDFVEEFDLPSSPSEELHPDSMEKLIDWMEDELKTDQTESKDEVDQDIEDLV
jgi:flagellar biosynthesis/type III secretory pathway M-ring protein FliF/YscJ